MLLSCAIVLAVLTRAELIERFKAPRVVQVDGLVEVRAECGPEMRREYQLPIACFAANVCRRLYASDKLKERHFAAPGVVIVIGDVATNLTNVVSRAMKRDDGSLYNRILLPSPGYADKDALVVAVTKGYELAVHSRELSDAEAIAKFRKAVPELKIADDYRSLAEWYDGKRGKADDEEMLKLQRGVLQPGVATKHDVEIFASRLFLFPMCFDQPFLGRFDCVSFREAIGFAKIDPRIRYAAYLKIQETVLYSGGRGQELADAGVAYSNFLRDLCACKKTEAELTAELDAADELLKGVLK